MGHMKKLIGLCIGLMMVIIGSIAVATPVEALTTRIEKTNASGTFVSANFDFDHADLSTPANHGETQAIGTVIGKFTNQNVNEYAPDLVMKTCMVPGGVANAGTEFTQVGDVGASRSTATGDLLFFKGTSATVCEDLSKFPTPPFPFIETETGVVTGGTGANFGATGTFTATAKGAALSLDATGVRGFGWFKNKVVTTVTVP